MANRRCLHALTRQYASILSSSNPSFQSPQTLIPALEQTLAPPNILPLQPAKSSHIFTNLRTILYPQYTPTCHFSSRQSDDSDREEEEGEGEGEEEEEEEDDDDYGSDSTSNCAVKREYTLEEKEKEAAAIGYKVIGPLERSDKVFKPYEPAFAVVQIGSHQFKVSNGDSIYTERLKFCEVNDKLILNRVLMLGSQNQTIIGRPILPDAAVHAVVEEHALDAKVIIFKKKRRKNYRRTKGHRQELTKLRITDIQGIEKPQLMSAGKIQKSAVKKPEKVAVPA